MGRTVRVELALSLTIPVAEEARLWVALVSEEMIVMIRYEYEGEVTNLKGHGLFI